MRATNRTLLVFLQVLGGLVLFAVVWWVPVAVGFVPGIIGELLLLLVNGWAVYAFLRYRQARQDELARVLAAAVSAGLPLAPAVRSYCDERPPRGSFRKLLTGLAY